jgi:hypothetical protein
VSAQLADRRQYLSGRISVRNESGRCFLSTARQERYLLLLENFQTAKQRWPTVTRYSFA